MTAISDGLGEGEVGGNVPGIQETNGGRKGTMRVLEVRATADIVVSTPLDWGQPPQSPPWFLPSSFLPTAPISTY